MRFAFLVLSLAVTTLCACGTAVQCQPGSCPAGQHCVYVNQEATPSCRPACDALDAGACSGGLTCGCGASCQSCKNCVSVCQ